MLRRCPPYMQEGSHQGGLGANKLLLGTSTCKFLVTKQENIFKANCLSRRWMQQERVTAVSTVIFWQVSMSPTCTGVHAHARTQQWPIIENVMRFLMLPLPLMRCYIHYIFLQTYTVLVASAPSIHGNSQWVPTLRHTHPHKANLRCRNARLMWQIKLQKEA